MKGQLIILKATGEKVATDYTSVIPLETLQKGVGGYIETVPGFDTYEGNQCVAFCNEEGKLDGLPFNPAATAAWDEATDSSQDDILVGDVVIVTGDDEFLEHV